MDIVLRDEHRSIQRRKLRNWLELDRLRELISKATDVDYLAELISQYLLVALDFSIDFDELSWEETASLFIAALSVNNEFESLPFMQYSSKTDHSFPYDYEGRTFYHYAHSLAQEYGWSIEYIAELDVDEALKMLQEIVISHHHQREWEWDLSDRAVGYDSATKKSTHVPYPMPDWMRPTPPEPKIYRIPKSLLPVGNVISFRDVKSD